MTVWLSTLLNHSFGDLTVISTCPRGVVDTLQPRIHAASRCSAAVTNDRSSVTNEDTQLVISAHLPLLHPQLLPASACCPPINHHRYALVCNTISVETASIRVTMMRNFREGPVVTEITEIAVANKISDTAFNWPYLWNTWTSFSDFWHLRFWII